jgi:hypothetical protein
VIGHAVTYLTELPGSDLCWVIRTEAGPWLPYVPPDDWGRFDYEAATAPPSAFRAGPVSTEAIYLASTAPERRSLVLPKGVCASFASTRPTPANVLAMAKKYGLLGRQRRSAVLSREESSLLLLQWDVAGRDEFELCVEPAFDWLYVHALMNSLLGAWDRGLKASSHGTEIPKLLDHEFEGGRLAIDLRMNVGDQKICADLVATSLADALKIQLAMLIASDAILRQCTECSGWFIVTPGMGRREKLYCSDACKMRAYRSRKAVT